MQYAYVYTLYTYKYKRIFIHFRFNSNGFTSPSTALFAHAHSHILFSCIYSHIHPYICKYIYRRQIQFECVHLPFNRALFPCTLLNTLLLYIHTYTYIHI